MATEHLGGLITADGIDEFRRLARQRAHQCERKTRYPTQIDADMVAVHMKKREAHSYHCEFCDGFHIGGIVPKR